jgi:hypothetical protein
VTLWSELIGLVLNVGPLYLWETTTIDGYVANVAILTLSEKEERAVANGADDHLANEKNLLKN